MLILSLESTFF